MQLTYCNCSISLQNVAGNWLHILSANACFLHISNETVIARHTWVDPVSIRVHCGHAHFKTQSIITEIRIRILCQVKYCNLLYATSYL